MKIKMSKPIRIFILCIFVSGIALAISTHEVNPENNPIGVNYYNDVVKGENIPDVIPYADLIDYSSLIDVYRPYHHASMFVIVLNLFQDQNLIFQIHKRDSVREWVQIKLPIKEKYFISDFELFTDTASSNESYRITCEIDRKDTTKNRKFEFIIDTQELKEITKK
jgi:hypothetical protein